MIVVVCVIRCCTVYVVCVLQYGILLGAGLFSLLGGRGWKEVGALRIASFEIASFEIASFEIASFGTKGSNCFLCP